MAETGADIFRSAAWIACVCCTIVLFAACAQVKSPGGGPVDEEPPRVVSVAPADSSVSVERDTDVVMRFSERMSKSTVEDALFIAPYPEPYPRLRWSHGDTELRLEFGGRLAEDRTYVITVGTGASDIHNVHLDPAHTCAFATGDSLDEGRISGTIYQLQGAAPVPASGLTVGLFPLVEGDTVSVYDRYAEYESQTGSDGSVTFTNLAPGRYRLIAWNDRQHDYRVGTDEPVALPVRDIVLDQGADAELPPTMLSDRDAEAPELLYTRAVDQHHIELNFSEDVDVGSVQIRTSGEDSLDITVLAQAAPQKRITAWTGQQTPRTTYAVDVTVSDAAGNSGTWAADSTLFEAGFLPDTAGPRIVQQVVPQPLTSDTIPEFTFWFDDLLAADAVDSLRMVADSLPIPGSWTHTGPGVVAFRPAEPVPPGVFTWSVLLDGVRDTAGNGGTDTVAVSVNRVGERSLGGFSGRVTDSDGSGRDTGPVMAQLIPLRESWRQLIRVADDGSWAFDQLPGVSYVVLAWRDADNDSVLSSGAVDPFVPAERWTVSDTITVRPGWMFEGVNLRIPW